MKYLAFDHHWKKWGRIQKLSTESVYISIEFSNGEAFKTRYKEEFAEIKVGDWVAIDQLDQLIRVTPSTRQPEFKNSKDMAKKWSDFFFQTQKYFLEKQFIHVPTPSLVVCPGTEPTIESFSTEVNVGQMSVKRFFPTSPELHLKKALARDFSQVFEIAKCYRNSELTDLHQPEFWMLEWYRSFSDLERIQVDCVDLISKLSKTLKLKRPSKVVSYTIPQLFKSILNAELTPEWTRNDYLALAKSLELRVTDDFSIDDLFFLIMLEKIESTFVADEITFVEKYPPFQAALARRDEKGWALRFEMYWQGMELANAFDELNDPVEQRNRAAEDLKKRTSKSEIQLDEEFFQALEMGMPPSAGVALGLDRLFMALHGIKTIQETRLFPFQERI